jgi:uncharacterized protein
MGLRLILFLFAIWVIYSIVRHTLRRKRNATALRTKRPEVDMVRCQHCGIHLPAPESLQQEGKHYCSREHLEADRRIQHGGE